MIMNKWELTRYLIDAKKCVDNIMFISLNIKSLINLSVRDIVDNRLRKFYINLKVVYDNVFQKKSAEYLQMKILFIEIHVQKEIRIMHTKMIIMFLQILIH